MEKRLKRSRNQFIGGVCAGFADYVGWDPTLVRVLYAVLTFGSFGFPGIIVYLVCWAVMPLEGLE